MCASRRVLLAVESAAERRLTAAKAACCSVTPAVVRAVGRIARENAILLSIKDTFARDGGQQRGARENPGGGSRRPRPDDEKHAALLWRCCRGGLVRLRLTAL